MLLDSILKIGLLGTYFTLSLSDLIENHYYKNYYDNILKPIDNISIIMVSYNEENFIETAAKSIREQSIIQKYPQYFEFMLVDNSSTDNTINKALPYIDKLYVTPRGKLTGRNLGINMSEGNIIVAVDADIYYPTHWLNTMLKPFNDFNNLEYKDVIGVSGTILDYIIPRPLPIELRNILNIFNPNLFRNIMLGGNSAFWKHYFYLTGKFNENINQLNLKEVNKEEEIFFAKRLSEFGRITYVPNASCIHLGGERTGCRLKLIQGEICNKYKFGIEQFTANN